MYVLIFSLDPVSPDGLGSGDVILDTVNAP